MHNYIAVVCYYNNGTAAAVTTVAVRVAVVAALRAVTAAATAVAVTLKTAMSARTLEPPLA